MRLILLLIFDGDIMDGYQYLNRGYAGTAQDIGCPSIITPLKMGEAKNLIFYSLVCRI